MKAVISKEGDQVAEHFGRCSEYTIIELNEARDKIVKRQDIKNPGHSPGFLPSFFNDMGAGLIITGGMGRKAINLFESFKIKRMIGVSGNIEKVIEELKAGTLKEGKSNCTG